jgi:hypothetical protein
LLQERCRVCLDPLAAQPVFLRHPLTFPRGFSQYAHSVAYLLCARAIFDRPVAMARSMDFIYADGDTPGVQKWLPRSSYIFAALFLYHSFRDLQGSKS